MVPLPQPPVETTEPPPHAPSTATFTENGKTFTRASVHDLVGLFEGHTSFQGNKAIAPFKGLWIRTQGTVEMITPNASGYDLILKVGSDQIQCTGQNSTNQDLTKVNNGDSLKAQGTIGSLQYGGRRLLVNNCEIMPSSRSVP
jgi:hypothetical protein